MSRRNDERKDEEGTTTSLSSSSSPPPTPLTPADLRRLDWTAKQGRILSGHGRAAEWYVAERGFPFRADELPHHHVIHGTKTPHAATCPVRGAWTRPLFVGGWEHSTAPGDEFVANVQTNALFVDLRIPHGVVPRGTTTSLAAMDDLDLRRHARQHAFAGVTVTGRHDGRVVCTRHHCIDWNFVGVPRNRPNKWYVERPPPSQDGRKNDDVWKEWSFAKDDLGQHYYCERWERLPQGTTDRDHQELVLAMRKAPGSDRDGVLVAVGDYFNYVHDRVLTAAERETARRRYDGAATLVGLVDAAVARGDRHTAEAWLSLEAGHGRVSSSWRIDRATRPWREGAGLFDGDEAITVVVTDADAPPHEVSWNGEPWHVVECSLATCRELQELFDNNGHAGRGTPTTKKHDEVPGRSNL